MPATTELVGLLSTKGLADRQVRSRITTADVDLSGDRVLPDGIDLSGFLSNPIVLFAHDHALPVAKVIDLQRSATEIVALMQFPDEGVSPKADEVYGLVKSGVISALSVSLLIEEAEPA
jgi:uncharacterized protein